MTVDTIKAGQKWQGKVAGCKVTVLHAAEHKTSYHYGSHKSIASTTTFCVRNDVFLSAFQRVKRQSTTAKITRGIAEAIQTATLAGDGVIVRFKGRELGIERVCDDGRTGVYYDHDLGVNCHIALSLCTVRKATIEAIHREFC